MRRVIDPIFGILMCLLLAACGSAGQSHAAPKATPVPQIAWQARSAPPGDNAALNDEIAFAVAPSDGHTAYWCSVTQVQPTFNAQMWVTHDDAHHWSKAAPLPGVQQLTDALSRQGVCKITIDGGDANVLYVEYGFHSGADLISSVDGGRTWIQPGQSGFTDETTTLDDVAYRHAYDSVTTSHDHGATWQPLTIPTAPNEQLNLLGVDPTNTHILIEGRYSLPQYLRLWRSDDGGAHWSATPLAQTPFQLPGQFIVRLLADQREWEVCFDAYPPTDSHTLSTIFCSYDSGHSWRQIPTQTGNSDNLLGIDGAGDLLRQVFVYGATNALYRYDTASQLWRVIGVANFALYAPNPAPGVLWDFKGEQIRVAAYR